MAMANQLVERFCYLRDDLVNKNAMVASIQQKLDKLTLDSQMTIGRHMLEQLICDCAYQIQLDLMGVKQEFIGVEMGQLRPSFGDVDLKIAVAIGQHVTHSSSSE
jgi:hypothetical protein